MGPHETASGGNHSEIRRTLKRGENMTALPRRDLLTGTAAMAAGLAALSLAGSPGAQAAPPPAGTQAPGWYRYKVGTIEVTVVTDGANKFRFADDHVTNKSRTEIN